MITIKTSLKLNTALNELGRIMAPYAKNYLESFLTNYALWYTNHSSYQSLDGFEKAITVANKINDGTIKKNASGSFFLYKVDAYNASLHTMQRAYFSSSSEDELLELIEIAIKKARVSSDNDRKQDVRKMICNYKNRIKELERELI